MLTKTVKSINYFFLSNSDHILLVCKIIICVQYAFEDEPSKAETKFLVSHIQLHERHINNAATTVTTLNYQ